MKSILNTVKLIARLFWEKRILYAPGMAVFFTLFLFSMLLNLSVSYMGNTNEAVAREIISRYWALILLQSGKVLLVYLMIGGFWGTIFSLGLLEFQQVSITLKSRYSIPLLSGMLVFLVALLKFFETIIIHPQLFIENFASHAKLFEKILDELAGNASPYIFSVPLYLLFGAGTAGAFVFAIRKGTARPVIQRMRHVLRNKKVVAAGGIIAAGMALYWISGVFNRNETAHPNILIISSDAVRPDHLGVNGYFRDTSPNIDAIARNSMQIRGMMTTVPRTFPSWVSILTSQYPLSHNIRHMFPRSRERNVVFDSACRPLSGLGYLTGVVSDFAGDIFPRIDLGFEKVLAPTLSFPVLIRQIILEKQTFLLPFLTCRMGWFLFPEMRGIAKYSQHGRVTDETIDLIRTRGSRPFFITAFYSVTHFPFAAPYPYYKWYSRPDYRGPYRYYKQVVIQMDNGGQTQGSGETDFDREQVIALYDGCLKLFDIEVGRLFDFLRADGLLENTIVVITSDHGENLYDRDYGMGHGEHLRGYPSLEIPMIIHAPASLLPERGTKNAICSSIDIMPTIFDIARLPRQQFFQGRSLAAASGRDGGRDGSGVDAYSETGLWFDLNKKSPLFFHQKRFEYPDITGISELEPGYHEEVVIQQRYQNFTNAAKYRAIFSEGYKLIYMPLPEGVRYELYDQVRDPMNDHDLSRTKKDVLEKMKRRFEDFVVRESNRNFIVKNGYLFPVFSDPVF